MGESNRGDWRPPGYRAAEERSAATGEHVEDNQAERRSTVTGADIEMALRAADGLIAEDRLLRRQEALTRLYASIAIALILAASSITEALLSEHLGTTAFKVFVGIATFAILATLPTSLWVLRTRNRSRSAYLRLGVAQDITAMLDEVVLSVAEREHWSYVRLEATKLRLSAFPLSRTDW